MTSLLLLLSILAVDPIEAKVITENNIKYVCLLPEPAQKLLELRLDFPLLQKQVLKYAELVEIGEAENERLNQAISDLSGQLAAQNQVNTILQAALNEPTPWYKKSSFWAVAGVFFGVGMTVLIYEVLEHDHSNLATTTTNP